MNEVSTKIATVQLQKPGRDTAFAQQSAKLLVDIIEQNGWSRSFGGQSKHLQYEAWQTAGKFYGYTVKTGEAQYVKYGEIEGFEAKAWVIDSKTGIEIGGAEAACMRDEANWKGKPLFQLKSMAQTRAGSKALRQILGFVVALAGYSPTPAEEITGTEIVREALPVAEKANPQSFDRCSECNGVITAAVYKFSMDRYKKPLCMNDQKNAESNAEDPKWIQDDNYLKRD